MGAKMEQLNEKGLHLDDLQRLRVLEPDSVDQANDLKDECGNLTTQMDDFRKMTDQFISLTDQISKQVEDEKLETLGARNKLKSMTENRKQEQQKLTALIVEKKMEYERLRIHYESLLKDHEDQKEFIEQFMLQK